MSCAPAPAHRASPRSYRRCCGHCLDTPARGSRDRSVAPGREAGSADAIRVADVGALSAQELQITASRRGGTTPRWQ
jgi:hypothetical protein